MKKSEMEGSDNEISKRLDILIAINLARSGIDQNAVGKVLNVSGKTVSRMIPFRKIKQAVIQ